MPVASRSRGVAGLDLTLNVVYSDLGELFTAFDNLDGISLLEHFGKDLGALGANLRLAGGGEDVEPSCVGKSLNTVCGSDLEIPV